MSKSCRPVVESAGKMRSRDGVLKSIVQHASLLILFFHVLAFAQTAPARKPLSIVVDDWWNIDYVRSSCQLYAQLSNPCTRGPQEIVREFESEFEVAFATESSCHGVALLHFTPEMAQAAVKNPTALATGGLWKLQPPIGN